MRFPTPRLAWRSLGRKYFIGPGWCFIMFPSPTEILKIHLNSVGMFPWSAHSPPILLMVEVMDLDPPCPIACCIDGAVSFPVVPMLTLPS